MKKLLLAAALIGMTGFAFGQQQQTAAASKDAKCSKTCMKSCGKNCKKGSCCTNGTKTSTATSTTAPATPTK